MEPIGYVQSCFKDRFGTPRQPGLVPSATAFLKIDSKWQPSQSLQGLESYSHLWVIFVFHKNTNQRFHAKVHPPRLEGQSIGVFATRSPHRPNPIGLSVVKIQQVESDGIWVSGQDIVDGSPILDIKPYLPAIEKITDASGSWTDNIQAKEYQLIWSESSIQTLKEWQAVEPALGHNLKNLVEETIRLDPRPTVYKKSEPGQYREDHVVRLGRGDVFFDFKDTNKIEILRIVYPVKE